MLYPERQTEKLLAEKTLFTARIGLGTSLFGVVTIITKFRMQASWKNYNSPMSFYRKILRSQVDLGLQDNTIMNSPTVQR